MYWRTKVEQIGGIQCFIKVGSESKSGSESESMLTGQILIWIRAKLAQMRNTNENAYPSSIIF